LGEYNCSICKDEKHVITPEGNWVRCSCLEKEIFNRQLTRAGILYPKDQLDFSKIASEFPHVSISSQALKVAESLQELYRTKNFPSNIYCFQGSVSGPCEMIVQAILLGAISAGKTVYQCSMEQVLANILDESGESTIEEEFNKAKVTSLNFGTEMQFKVSTNVIQEFLRLKQIYPVHGLMFHTNLTWDQLSYKYGDAIQSIFVQSYQKTFDREKRIIFLPVEE
jgi:hypothetical protein